MHTGSYCVQKKNCRREHNVAKEHTNVNTREDSIFAQIKVNSQTKLSMQRVLFNVKQSLQLATGSICL